MNAEHDAAFWADAVAEAYAAAAKPPLTRDLVDQVRATLLEALVEPLEPGLRDDARAGKADRLNAALDGFEIELRAVVGPRVASLDETSGAVVMEHRSEAGQPLRAFGGQ